MDYGLIFVIFAILFLAFMVGSNILIVRRERAAWKEFASQLSLKDKPGSTFGKASASGVYRGRSLLLDTFASGRGNEITCARITLGVKNPAGICLSISGEGINTTLGKLLGAEEIKMGDEAFDSRFYIESSPENAARRLFSDASLRQKLVGAFSIELKCEGKQITYQRGGFKIDPQNLRNCLDLAADVAEAVDRLE